MRKFMIAAAVAACAWGPAVATAQEAPDFVGTWSGLVVQTFTDGRTASFSAMIVIRPGGTGESAYPTDHCGGTLRFQQGKRPLSFTETITYGNDVCANGTVILTRIGDTLEYRWSAEGAGTAVGTLHPTDKTIPPH